MIYLYADPHFNHRNMAEVFTLSDGSKARPFTSVEEMDQTLLSNYREAVGEEDVVWWLGDVCFKPHQQMIDLIASLPGRRHLILGNHDRENVGRYVRMGFEKIRSSWQTDHLLITHIPVHPNSLSRRGTPMVNVHGHTHTACYDGPYVNVCVEQTQYRPIAWEEVLRLAQRKREGLV